MQRLETQIEINQKIDARFARLNAQELVNAALGINPQEFDEELLYLGTKLKDQALGEALRVVATRHQFEAAISLLKLGANINYYHYGKSLLHEACREGDKALVDFLLQHGANPNTERERPRERLGSNQWESHWDKWAREVYRMNEPTPLCLATENANIDITIIQALLQAGAKPNHSVDRTTATYSYPSIPPRVRDLQTTPLISAVKNGRVDIIRLLVQAGAYLSVEISGYFSTPLHYAARIPKNNAAVIETLIELGAEVHVRNGLGLTPLRWVIEYKHREQVLSLLPTFLHVSKETPQVDLELYLAVYQREIPLESVNALIAQGANLNITDRKGRTPLYIAIQNRRLDVAMALLTAGADVNAKSFSGKTPFLLALKRKYFSSIGKHLLKTMIDQGANANGVVDKKGLTPLHHAVCTTDLETIRLLLLMNVDIDAKTPYGQTALHIALSSLTKDMSPVVINIINLLLENGADVNAVTCEGKTPLALALRYTNAREIASKLIALGAKRDAHEARRAADTGIVIRHPRVVAAMLQKAASQTLFGDSAEQKDDRAQTSARQLKR